MGAVALHLDPADPDGLAGHRRAQGWLTDDETPVSVQRAGEGNMNLALRVTTDRRTLIVKQGRPWVEKHPDIAAPEDRTAPGGFDRSLAQGFAGIEIIRRLLGVSKLPLRADLAGREALLERGRALVLG